LYFRFPGMDEKNLYIFAENGCKNFYSELISD